MSRVYCGQTRGSLEDPACGKGKRMRSTALRLGSLAAVAALFAAVAVLATPSGTAEADGHTPREGPPLNAGPHEQPSDALHDHYIIKGNGDCMVLKAPQMVFDVRGLHHGANMSSGATPGDPTEPGEADGRGPWHVLGPFGCPNGD